MSANFKQLGETKIQKKIGSMYLGVALDDEVAYGLSLSVVFLIRRSVFVAITFGLLNYPSLQLQLFIFTSILYISYLNTFHIYKENFMLVFEYLNECILLCCAYLMLFFTNVLPKDDPHTP